MDNNKIIKWCEFFNNRSYRIDNNKYEVKISYEDKKGVIVKFYQWEYNNIKNIEDVTTFYEVPFSYYDNKKDAFAKLHEYAISKIKRWHKVNNVKRVNSYNDLYI